MTIQVDTHEHEHIFEDVESIHIERETTISNNRIFILLTHRTPQAGFFPPTLFVRARIQEIVLHYSAGSGVTKVTKFKVLKL